MIIRKGLRACLYLLCSSAIGLTVSAHAQTATSDDNSGSGGEQPTDASSGNLGEIVVTAERTSTLLRTTPVSITAIGSEELARRGITNVGALVQSIPNLTFGDQVGAPNLNIRGIGLATIATGQESSVAYNFNGIYLARPSAAQAGFYDLARIEVLRGPQGTLYGRNATGGAINVIPNEPSSTFGGYMSLEGGEYGWLETTGAVTGPLADGVSGRLAFHTVRHDGFGKNIATGNDVGDENSYALRGSLKFELSPQTEIILEADYFRQRDASVYYTYIKPGAGITPYAFVPVDQPGFAGGLAGSHGGGGSPAKTDTVYDVANDRDPTVRRTYYGTTLDIDHQAGDVNIHSKFGYRVTKYDVFSDIDGSDAYFSNSTQFEHARQFSGELQASARTGSLEWLAGAFYFYERTNGSIIVTHPNTVPDLTGGAGTEYVGLGTLKTNAAAAYVNLRYHFNEQLSLVLGGRYSYERKSLDNFGTLVALAGPPSVGFYKKHWEAFTPRAVIEFKPTPDIFLYASATRGFKSGGYNVGAIGTDPTFDPEYIWSYEGGIKAKIGRGLQANLSGFYYDYSDLQVSVLRSTTISVENAANARIYGVELELTANPVENLQLSLAASGLSAKFTSYTSDDPVTGAANLDLSGNTLPQAPRYTFSFGGNYDIPLASGAKVTLNVTGKRTGRQYFSVYNRSDTEQQGAYFRGDASITYTSPSEAWEIGAFVRNFGAKHPLSNSFIGTALLGFPELGFYQPPTRVGAMVKVNF